MLSSIPAPRFITYPLTATIESIESYTQAGYAYAVDADNQVAVLTSPFADEDTTH